ncbi:MAG: methyl-accepting chemotaxis protein [Burkholderiales bacterium]|nr:methyl-accepting chemotaxis protein [Burkholderiales bacterium]
MMMPLARRFANMRINRKVLAAPLALVAALLAQGALLAVTMDSNQSALLKHTEAADVQHAATSAFGMSLMRLQGRLFHLTATAANDSDGDKVTAAAKSIGAAIEPMNTAFGGLRQALPAPEAVPLLDQAATALAAYLKQARNVVNMADTDAGAALMFVMGAERAFAELEKRVKAIEEEVYRQQAANVAALKAALQRRLLWGGGVVAALALLGLLGAIAASRAIAGPVAATTKALEDLAAGRSTDLPFGDRRDEIGSMARSFLTLRRTLEDRADLEREKAAADANARRKAEAMAEIVARVGATVQSAVAGDFSQRIDPQGADGDLATLVDGINLINATVDTATREFAMVLDAVAAGDLTREVSGAYSGRLGEMGAAISGTIRRLAETLTTIQSTAIDVAAAAREINMGASDLSGRTEQQASSLEETAATTEQLAASVKASAGSSREAASLAGEATRVAGTGGTIVTKAVDAMARIEQASQKISAITSVIDDIAFQTNLLALNAAVEAARAGEAGKGFAVVASEVRTLAQRSSEAAKDITGLIQSSNHEVQQGVELVRSAGDALTRIVEASEKVAATVATISSAANEQANGIDEMTQAVAHMDEMTQQNAALAEESAASSSALLDRIGQLNDLVATFRTRSDTRQSRLRDSLPDQTHGRTRRVA